MVATLMLSDTTYSYLPIPFLEVVFGGGIEFNILI